MFPIKWYWTKQGERPGKYYYEPNLKVLKLVKIVLFLSIIKMP